MNPLTNPANEFGRAPPPVEHTGRVFRRRVRLGADASPARAHPRRAYRGASTPRAALRSGRRWNALAAATWSAGRAMLLEQAADYALSEDAPPTATAAEPDGAPLTARQLEVAQLVARGLTTGTSRTRSWSRCAPPKTTRSTSWTTWGSPRAPRSRPGWRPAG
jgi:hypothetical protein